MSAPVLIEWSHDSGIDCRVEAEAFVANWFNNLYRWPLGTREMEDCRLLLGARRQLVPGTQLRIYGIDPGFKNIAYTGDAVDGRGVRVTATPAAVLRLVEDEQGTIVFERPFPAAGLLFQPAPPLPSGEADPVEKMLCFAGSELLARCVDDGWHRPDGEKFDGKRGFLLYVAQPSWFDLQSGSYHIDAAQHRSRLSPLAARLDAAA